MENKNTFQRILWTIAGAEIPILENVEQTIKSMEQWVLLLP